MGTMLRRRAWHRGFWRRFLRGWWRTWGVHLLGRSSAATIAGCMRLRTRRRAGLVGASRRAANGTGATRTKTRAADDPRLRTQPRVFAAAARRADQGRWTILRASLPGALRNRERSRGDQ